MVYSRLALPITLSQGGTEALASDSPFWDLTQGQVLFHFLFYDDVATASGLYDYDPTVYLHVLSGGGQIRSEFLVLRKALAASSIL